MIGWISDAGSSASIFDNINYIDTAPAFKEARQKIEFIIPSFIKYISGDRTKSKIYGQIKRFYPEELIYMDKNILEHNINNIQNIDTLIEDSCTLNKDLRVVVVKDKLQLSSITGYEFVTFTRGDNHINTLFIEDKELDVKFTFSICLKLFDIIITSCLYDNKIPVNDRTIRFRCDDNNLIYLSKFIVDYFYELLYPFEKSLALEKDEINAIVLHIARANCNVLEDDTITDLYYLMVDMLRGRADDYDYTEFIIRVMDELKHNDNHKSYVIKPL